MSSELRAKNAEQGLLPVHGFVLAGGKSSRMGTDKALLEFCGRMLVEIAVSKLREFCAEVSIVGNRDDLSGFAPVVRETRLDIGPAAGIEAGLGAATQPWAMFVPVDVPLVPGELLRRWAENVVSSQLPGLGVSFLMANQRREPIFNLVRRDCVRRITALLDRGERRVGDLLEALDDNEGESWLAVKNAADFASDGTPSRPAIRYWFSNLNTPQDFDEAESWAASAREVDSSPR